jgi:hypothetical protein
MRGLLAAIGLLLLLGAAGPARAAVEPSSGEGPEVTQPKKPQPLWTQRKRPRGLTYGGKLWTSLAPDLRMAGPYEDRFEWHSGIDFSVKYRFADNARFVLGANLRYVLRSGADTEAALSLDVGEAYLQFRKGRFSLRAGRFLHTWGRNALLSPLNRVAPIDAEMAFAPEGAERARIPTLAVRANLGLHPLALELVWLPIFQPARVSFYGHDFSLLRPGMIEGLLPSLVPRTGAGLADDAIATATDFLVESLGSLDPYARDGIQSNLLFGVPEEYLWNGDIGGRIGITGRGVDFDFVALWHTLDQPELKIAADLRRPLLANRLPDSGELTRLTNPGSEPIESVYHRSLMAGADVAVATGGFVISAEAAYNTRGIYYRRDFSSYLSPHVNYAVAARYLYGTWAAFSLEFSHDILTAPQDDSFLRDQHQLRVAFLGSLRLFAERLQLTLTAAWDILQRDLYVHPRVVVVVSDRFQVAFGASIFEGYGEDVTPSLDSIRSYQGGLIGYYRHNDYGYATVQLSY